MANGPENRACLLMKLYQYFSFLVFVFQTKLLSRQNSLLSESTEAIGIPLCVGVFLIRTLHYVFFPHWKKKKKEITHEAESFTFSS